MTHDRKHDRNRARPAAPPEDPAADLLVRFREGDPFAFDELVAEFEPRLVQFFYRLCWDRSRAEDLSQNLFLKLLRHADRYRPEGKLGTFIFRVATNLWIDRYRSERPRRRMFSLDQAVVGDEPPQHATHDPSPLESASLDEDKARMRAALEQLTEPHRLVFELAIYQELPYAEISKVLGIPVGTVKSRMHNSVKALRELLKERSVGRQIGGVDRRPFRSGGIA